jgi:hypothetical protein
MKGHLPSKTYEQWERGFLTEPFPENELRLWGGIADVWEKFCAAHPEVDKAEACQRAVAVTMGVTGLPVPFNELEPALQSYVSVIRERQVPPGTYRREELRKHLRSFGV